MNSTPRVARASEVTRKHLEDDKQCVSTRGEDCAVSSRTETLPATHGTGQMMAVCAEARYNYRISKFKATMVVKAPS